MNFYNVYVPITGVLIVTVKAENENQAMEIALDSESEFQLKIEKLYKNSEIEFDLTDFELQERIVSGNVFHGSLNEIDVELVEEFDDENE